MTSGELGGAYRDRSVGRSLCVRISILIVAEAKESKDVPPPSGMAVSVFEWIAGRSFGLITRLRS